jgi:large subunit ribosomal protein L21
MFAIIRAGGRQHRVREGDVVAVDKLDAAVGTRLELGNVLMLVADDGVRVGTPVLPGAKVTVEVISHERGPKVTVFKFRRRKNYKRLRGHRQTRTLLKILTVAQG